MSTEHERLVHIWLKDWRRKIDAEDFDDPETVRAHFVEIQRLLLDICCPTIMHEARESLSRYYAERAVADEEIPGPPACAGGGCGED